VAQMVAALQAQPATTAEDELAHLSLLAENAALKDSIEPVLASVSASHTKDTARPARPDTHEIRAGVFLKVEGGWTKPILILSGPNVDPGFRERLEDWLKNP
jgi:hypothetical protein